MTLTTGRTRHWGPDLRRPREDDEIDARAVRTHVLPNAGRVPDNGRVTTALPTPEADPAQRRKARGAFFTPAPIAEHIVTWAVRDAADRVMEPSAGDAGFLVAAVERIRELADGGAPGVPVVDGVEIHEHSARVGAQRVQDAGGTARIEVADFFDVPVRPEYDAVIGNPPFIRYQDFSGKARAGAREAAAAAGVRLTGLASSWAAFVVHSARFLCEGGRLGLVLPAELLSVNYAAPVRRYLLESFAELELVRFDRQVFGEAEADVVLVLADGYGRGPVTRPTVRAARDAEALAEPAEILVWEPRDPAAKWTESFVDPAAMRVLRGATDRGAFVPLQKWGKSTLGMVTGNNGYFVLSPAQARAHGLTSRDLLPVSPAGSRHLRGLELTSPSLDALGRLGRGTRLFRPVQRPSAAARRYIAHGEDCGVHLAYKCRMRAPWYRVPLVEVADLLLTCMNADTPRLTTNAAGVLHLNSVHGVYLHEEVRELGRELLPLASLNSLTLLSAEVTGRTYGGGILKMEPREADVWQVPSPVLLTDRASALRAVRKEVTDLLASARLRDAVAVVDRVLFDATAGVDAAGLTHVSAAHRELGQRRITRGASGR